MIFSVYSLSIAFGMIFLVVIIELVRKNRLLEKYSLLWIFFGLTLLILSSSPFFMESIARFLDIKYAPSVLFLFGMVYLIIYSLNITVVFSRQSQKITSLNQEIALLKERLEHEKKNGGKDKP
ncbi:MAG TPA: DUF2304 domain-containing protein [Candidatus Nitrosocosmicus sp.]|nr:DUF2304 domain-containing protein [Candidatus Nitrosocosmicus sp.]